MTTVEWNPTGLAADSGSAPNEHTIGGFLNRGIFPTVAGIWLVSVTAISVIHSGAASTDRLPYNLNVTAWPNAAPRMSVFKGTSWGNWLDGEDTSEVTTTVLLPAGPNVGVFASMLFDSLTSFQLTDVYMEAIGELVQPGEVASLPEG